MGCGYEDDKAEFLIRTDPLDIGYTNASSESLASADTVVPWIALAMAPAIKGQVRHVLVVSLQTILRQIYG